MGTVNVGNSTDWTGDSDGAADDVASSFSRSSMPWSPWALTAENNSATAPNRSRVREARIEGRKGQETKRRSSEKKKKGRRGDGEKDGKSFDFWRRGGR